LARGAVDVGGVGPILGEESGLGDTEALPDLGKSSSFFRASCGVGGVELLASKKCQRKAPIELIQSILRDTLLRVFGFWIRAEDLQSPSSLGDSLGGPMSLFAL